MPITIEPLEKGARFGIAYDLAWLHQVMQASASSMVPFSFFTSFKSLSKNRLYPRSFKQNFTLGNEESSSASAGGRKPAEQGVEWLCELLGDPKRPVPLNDIAILSKREVCFFVQKQKPKVKLLEILGGPLDSNDPRRPNWPIFGYPMLCIMGTKDLLKLNTFPNTQGEWRVVQCVFGAVLTQRIRAMKIGLEVVSREGFGSLFPTLADLPGGIRLDPGLLPPEAGSAAIASALEVVDEFIAHALKQKAKPDWIGLLEGMGSGALSAVDSLMAQLHKFSKEDPKATGVQYCKFVWTFKFGDCECKLDEVDETVKYSITGFPPAKLSKQQKKKPVRHKFDESDGYGSGSDYEEKDDEEQPKKKEIIFLKQEEVEEDIKIGKDLVIRKVSVVTGMAALRMATLFAMQYSMMLYTKGGLTGTLNEEAPLNSMEQWAPYFELDLKKLFGMAVGQSKAGVNVLLFDGAPNPINIPEKPDVGKFKELGAVVIDTTNNVSIEKATYVKFFQQLLVRPKEVDGFGGLLFLVESVSKHPTGGDLVHGVMRVCGDRKSVDLFFNMFLIEHLKSGNFKAKDQTVLTEEETKGRRLMIEQRLLMRNLDLWRMLLNYDPVK